MRTNIVSIVVGTRGTGKTDFTKDLVRNSRMPKKLIVDTFDNPPWRTLDTWQHFAQPAVPLITLDHLKACWSRGTYRLAESNTEETIQVIEQNVSNALIVWEDATRYIGSRLLDSMRKVILDSKQKNLDMVFVFHNLVSVPPELVRIADTLTLFKTNEGYPNESKYPWPEIPRIMDHLKKSPNRFENVTIRLN